MESLSSIQQKIQKLYKSMNQEIIRESFYGGTSQMEAILVPMAKVLARSGEIEIESEEVSFEQLFLASQIYLRVWSQMHGGFSGPSTIDEIKESARNFYYNTNSLLIDECVMKAFAFMCENEHIKLEEDSGKDYIEDMNVKPEIMAGENLNRNTNSSNLNAPMLGMKWYKFIIYFSLFASAIINIAGIMKYLLGNAYVYEGIDISDEVYDLYNGLQGLDILLVVSTLALVALIIVTRFRLSKFKKNGPKMLIFVYILAIASNLIYMVGFMIITNNSEINYTQTIMDIAASITFIIINSAYFRKRRHLFVN